MGRVGGGVGGGVGWGWGRVGWGVGAGWGGGGRGGLALQDPQGFRAAASCFVKPVLSFLSH